MTRVHSEVWSVTLPYTYRHIAFSCFFKNKSANLRSVTLTPSSYLPNGSHSSKASLLWCLSFFMIQDMTTEKAIGLVRGTFVDKVISLLFNMLSRSVTAFLQSNKHLLISWLQSPSAVILETKKIKSVTVSIV